VRGVTILSAAELSTPFGPLVQLDAPRLLPINQRQALDVANAVRRAGGMAVLAHPADLRRPWEGSLEGISGLEIADFASSARRLAGAVFVGLLPAAVVWPLRKKLGLLQLHDRDDGALKLWDGELDPFVSGYCGLSAHGWIPPRWSFLAWQMVIDSDNEPSALLQAMHAGRFYCITAIVGDSPRFSFTATLTDGSTVSPAVTLEAPWVEALVVQGPRLRSTSAGPATIVLLRNGEPIVRQDGSSLTYDDPTVGTYRVEIRIALPRPLYGSRTMPVIYSNRIRIIDSTSAEY